MRQSNFHCDYTRDFPRDPDDQQKQNNVHKKHRRHRKQQRQNGLCKDLSGQYWI